MKRSLTLVLVLGGLGVAFLAGSWSATRRSEGERRPASARHIVSYSCPMHPAYHSDRPGDCPSCGMRLEPVYEDGAGPGRESGGAALPPGTIQVSPEHQQAIGVQLIEVARASGEQTIRTGGRVVPDEARIYRLYAATDGWIQEVSDTSTGSMVRKGQRLGAYYSPALVPALQRYFLTMPSGDGSSRTFGTASVEALVQQATDQLRSIGLSEAQIEELNRTRALLKEIWILSPAPGFVLARNISLGQRFEKGAELYRIADLGRVWVLADMFESQGDVVRPGATARILVPQRRLEYEARVGNVEPLFDEATRTLKVRLEMENRGYALKPGMFVDVEFRVTLPSAVTVPADAVVNSGVRKTVFVDRGNGFFEPRRVETGWRAGDRVEIVKGLMPGERVVVSGNFLLDSESRMKAASQGFIGAVAKDPVCGMDVDEKKAAAGRKSEYNGTTYYFCSDDCKQKFDKDPAKYAVK
jgi:multidrug efflux pump subunit AcrA (membrane-fusion protein)/YHS domain-containing protein